MCQSCPNMRGSPPSRPCPPRCPLSHAWTLWKSFPLCGFNDGAPSDVRPPGGALTLGFLPGVSLLPNALQATGSVSSPSCWPHIKAQNTRFKTPTLLQGRGPVEHGLPRADLSEDMLAASGLDNESPARLQGHRSAREKCITLAPEQECRWCCSHGSETSRNGPR